jgi:hypothetical protein
VFEPVNVAHWNLLATGLPSVEQTECQDTSQVDEIWRWAQVEVYRLTEAELEQMDGHEGEQHHA